MAYASLSYGFAIIALGLWFDMHGAYRSGRFSAIEFWLHILVVLALVNTVAFSLYNLGGTLDYLYAPCLLFLVIIFSLTIDRRFFLTIVVSYSIAALIWIINQTLGEEFGEVSIVFILVFLLTAVGIWRVQMRGELLRASPEFYSKSKLPPLSIRGLNDRLNSA